MSERIATGCEVIIRGSLVLVGAVLIAITRRLIVIRPGLILVARRLLAIVQRLGVGRLHAGSSTPAPPHIGQATISVTPATPHSSNLVDPQVVAGGT